MPHDGSPIVAVFGSGSVNAQSALYAQARALGQALAHAGFVVMTGGYAGVMAAASQGAHESGAQVIGVPTQQFSGLPGRVPNPWITELYWQLTAQSRLHTLLTHADGCVVLPGGIGTLNELITGLELVRLGDMTPKRMVCLGPFWRDLLRDFLASPYVNGALRDLVHFVDTPEEAAALLRHDLRASGNS